MSVFDFEMPKDFSAKFPEPKTIEEARRRKRAIQLDVKVILTKKREADSGAIPLRHDDGREYDPDEINRWHTRARRALQIQENRASLLKQWISDYTADQRHADRVLLKTAARRLVAMAATHPEHKQMLYDAATLVREAMVLIPKKAQYVEVVAA